MSDQLRLPTFKQLEQMGNDAGKVLDFQEAEFNKLINKLPDDPSSSYWRRRLRQRIYKVQRRRDEFFGPEESTA